ncbi:DUF4012 domain-containing protein [Candidatus Parcubacteria bacterium]|nr:MAG: DUF4012 domain-containing protein [Candidatus Parcubacteria bacterium]
MEEPKHEEGRRAVDVRRPEREEDSSPSEPPIRTEEIAELVSEHDDELERPPRKEPGGISLRRVLLTAFSISVLGILVLAAVGYRASERALAEARQGLEAFRSAVSGVRLFENSAGSDKLRELETSVNSIGPSDIVLNFFPILRESAKAIAGVQELAGRGVLLAEEMRFLEEEALPFMLTGRGEDVLVHLRALRDHVAAVNRGSADVAESAHVIGSAFALEPDFFLPIQVDLNRLEQFLGPLIAWLEPDSGRRIAIFFHNTSEIRPGGGFLGSYAEILLARANADTVTVRDVNEVDRGMEDKIIPPEPLQLIATRWTAADSNWFFDFPTSAEKTLSLMERSSLYRDRKTVFDGALGVSPQVVGDLLELTGPIEIPEYKLTLTHENFLTELQREVQVGQERKVAYPKRVLEVVAAALLPKFAELDGERKQLLLERAAEWIKERDVLAYFRDPALQSFFRHYGAAGEVYELPSDFSGEYLAIVDANVGGAKTDIFVRQSVALESQINADGTVNNHLVVNRNHEGGKSRHWWYREPNQAYVKVFTPPGSKLVNFSGGTKKTVTPKVNYAKSGYAADEDIAAVESTKEEFFGYPLLRGYAEEGKQVFAWWSRTELGKKSTSTLDYSHRLPFPPRDGGKYQFVFEKQSGTMRSYYFVVSAPVGYRFRENGLPVYEYRSSDPPGRLIVDLTLEEI